MEGDPRVAFFVSGHRGRRLGYSPPMIRPRSRTAIVAALLPGLIAAPAFACQEAASPPLAALARLPAAQCGAILANIRDTHRMDRGACPSAGGNGSDPAFCRLVELGDAATSCLLDKVTDTAPMPNPGCPDMSRGRYAVGDLAYSVLTHLHDLPWQAPLPADVQARMRQAGASAYYDYVHAEPAARRQLRDWVTRSVHPAARPAAARP
jgi:hypothetical protein